MSDSLQIGQQASPPSASRPRKGARISLVVLHSDPRPAAEALAAYTAPRAQTAPHFYIDNAGTIAQLVPEDRAARHSGKATWNKRRRDIDRISIGVGLEHTPGAPYPPALLGALWGLIAKLRASYGIGAGGLVRWEPALPGLSTAEGLVLPAELLPPVAAPSAPIVLGDAEAEQPISDEGVICGGVTPAGPLVLGDEPIPGPLVLGDSPSQAQANPQLVSFLLGETYRQRGQGFHRDWSFHQYATKNNLGAPIAPSAGKANQVQFNNRSYGFQPFARDTLFNEIPNWSEVRSLNSALGGSIPAGGLERLLLEASYQASGSALHDNQAFHQAAVRLQLGQPLGSGYSIAANGQKLAIQVFSCDTLYTPYGVPEQQTNWGDVRRLSDEPAGPIHEALWAETYKVCGAAYQPESPFQALASREKLGLPLTGVYSVDFEGQPFSMQVFACDTLYAGQDGVVKRMSALPAASATAPAAAAVATAVATAAPAQPVQPEPGSLDDALSDQRHTFHVLPFASWPLIGQPYGYTKFAIQHRNDMYSKTQGRHSGIDFMVPVGTQLLSLGYGLVVGGGVPSTNEAPFGGCPPKVIIVRYGAVYAIYGHASQVLAQRGQFVKPGDLLGLSGDFNGPHLHFELRPVPPKLLGNRDPGQPALNSAIAINPLPFFSSALDAYFDQQYARLRGTSYDFCCDTFRTQPDTFFGQAVDARPCSN